MKNCNITDWHQEICFSAELLCCLNFEMAKSDVSFKTVRTRLLHQARAGTGLGSISKARA